MPEMAKPSGVKEMTSNVNANERTLTGGSDYYTLIVLDNDSGQWGIEFGDYNRSVVVDERSDMHDSAWPDKFTSKIIRTSDAQADIEERVQAMNKERDDMDTMNSLITVAERRNMTLDTDMGRCMAQDFSSTVLDDMAKEMLKRAHWLTIASKASGKRGDQAQCEQYWTDAQVFKSGAKSLMNIANYV